ncbi:hypothetical protein CSC88_34865 [Klebsiella pneumoniae]|nr:hypothetical protein CSC88_34865 [Klebsiella pneumoniae]
MEEGFLVIHHHGDLVQSAEKVQIRALDRDVKPVELAADRLLAICIKHEMDHLVGKLFIDYLSPLKQQHIRQKVEKLDHLRSRD